MNMDTAIPPGTAVCLYDKTAALKSKPPWDTAIIGHRKLTTQQRLFFFSAAWQISYDIKSKSR